MQAPPEIIIKGVEMTPLTSKMINRGIAGLEKVCNYIVNVHVTIEKEQRRKQTGNPLRMQIDIRIPNRTGILVKRESIGLKKIPDGMAEMQEQLANIEGREQLIAHPVRRNPANKRGIRQEPLESLITLTFASARRQLKKMMDKQRGEVKVPAQQDNMAMVEKLFRDQEYGFLRATDGQQVYFHRNSVLHKHWEKLTPGTAVRYTPELGEKGLQASTVELVDKPGVAETHAQLHDMPDMAPAMKVKKKAVSRAR